LGAGTSQAVFCLIPLGTGKGLGFNPAGGRFGTRIASVVNGHHDDHGMDTMAHKSHPAVLQLSYLAVVAAFVAFLISCGWILRPPWNVQDADAESNMPYEWRLSSGDEGTETDQPKL